MEHLTTDGILFAMIVLGCCAFIVWLPIHDAALQADRAERAYQARKDARKEDSRSVVGYTGRNRTTK